jgi:hypothetical protein
MPNIFDGTCFVKQQGRAELRQKYAELLRTSQENKDSAYSTKIFSRFLSQVFSGDPRKSLPVSSHWILFVQPENIKDIKTCIKEYSECEVDVSLDSLDSLFNEMGGYTSQGNPYVCLYCTGVSLPGDENGFELAGISQAGNMSFLKTPVTSNRNTPNTVAITFREHVVSYVDTFLRPWLIACSHKGSIDIGYDNLKSRIMLFRLYGDCSNSFNDIEIRDSFEFLNCKISNIPGEDLTYSSTSITERTCIFTYSKMKYTNYFGNESSANGAGVF